MSSFCSAASGRLVIHWKIDLNVIGGDDTVFLAYSQEEGFSLLPWLAERYMTWSSRTAIEAVLMVMVNLPAVVWRIADSFVVVIGAAALTRLLEKREYREYYSFFISLMFLALPYSYMSLAGWIATSMNYMWPLAFGLVAVYPIRKSIDGGKIRIIGGDCLYSLSDFCGKFRANGICDGSILWMLWTLPDMEWERSADPERVPVYSDAVPSLGAVPFIYLLSRAMESEVRLKQQMAS